MAADSRSIGDGQPRPYPQPRMRCPACGNPNRPEARFCDSCGAPLEAPEPAAEPAPAAMPPGSPELIAGRYRVEGFLGRGGRKRVFRARDSEGDDREVAVAVFDTEDVAETVLARARREALAMGKLGEHPHIVRVLDSGEDGGVPFIVSEYVGGGDLQGTLDDCAGRQLELERAIAIAIDVCRALEHAHARGIVHRDLKPANVWLGDDGAARLGDFGLATDRSSRAAVEGMLVGTVAYLPPEQALGRSSDARSDLYSLGAMLYELLTGEPPFPGEDAVAIIGQHLSAQPVAPSRHRPEVPAALDRVGARPARQVARRTPSERRRGAARDRRRPPPSDRAARTPRRTPTRSRASPAASSSAATPSSARCGTCSRTRSAAQGRLVLLSGDPGIGKTRDRRAARHLRPGPRRARLLGPLPRVRGPAAVLAVVGGAARLRPRRRPGRAALAARQPGRRRRPDRPRARRAARRRRRAAGHRHRAGALSGLRLLRRLPRRRLRRSARWCWCSTTCTGPTSPRCAAALRRPAARRHRPAADRRLPRRRARPPPPARRDARATSPGSRARGGSRCAGSSANGIADYIELTAGVERPPPDLAEAIRDQTGGNPFFIGEVVRLMAAEGRLGEADGRRAGGDPAGRARGRRPAPRPALRGGERRAADRRGLRARVPARGDRAGLRPPGRGDRGGAARGGRQPAGRGVEPRSRGGTRSRTRWSARRCEAEVPTAKRVRMHRRIGEALEERLRRRARSPRRRARPPLPRGRAAGRGRARGRLRDPGRRPRERPARPRGGRGPLRAGARRARARCRSPSATRRLGLLLELGAAQTKAARLRRRAGDARTRRGARARARRARAARPRGARHLPAVGGRGRRRAADRPADRGARAGRARATARCARTCSAASPRSSTGSTPPVARTSSGSRRSRWRAGSATRGALAAALMRRQFTGIVGPEQVRQAAAARAASCTTSAKRMGDRELEVRAHVYRLSAWLQLGDIRGVDADLAAVERLATRAAPAAVALERPPAAGDAGADRRSLRRRGGARRGGGRRGHARRGDGGGAVPRDPDRAPAPPAALARGRRRARTGWSPTLADLAERFPAIPAWRSSLAATHAELGHRSEARAVFEPLAAQDFADVPLDAQWSISLTLLAEVADDARRRAAGAGAVRAPQAVRGTGRHRRARGRLLRAGLAGARAARGDRRPPRRRRGATSPTPWR